MQDDDMREMERAQRRPVFPRGWAYATLSMLLPGENVSTFHPSRSSQAGSDDLRNSRRQHVDRAMSAAEAALLRWKLQRENLDIIEMSELEPDPLVAYAAMTELEPGEPPPTVESPGLLDIDIVVSAPRPGPGAGVVLTVG